MLDQAIPDYARWSQGMFCSEKEKKNSAEQPLMTGGDPAITLMRLFPVKRSTKPERVMTPD